MTYPGRVSMISGPERTLNRTWVPREVFLAAYIAKSSWYHEGPLVTQCSPSSFTGTIPSSYNRTSLPGAMFQAL